jgi:hypothetical protein
MKNLEAVQKGDRSRASKLAMARNLSCPGTLYHQHQHICLGSCGLCAYQCYRKLDARDVPSLAFIPLKDMKRQFYLIFPH